MEHVNVPEIYRWLLVAFLLVLAAALIILPVHAAVIRIDQGSPVYVGQYADISGVVGWRSNDGNYYLAYYGRSGYEMDPQYLYKITQQKALYNFYIDPKIFSDRIGPWFQFYGNTTESHGYTTAFEVMTEEDYQKTLPSYIEDDVTVYVTPEPLNNVPVPVVPPKRFDTDYVVAKGDSFNLIVVNTTQSIRFWLFGRIDSMYNRSFASSRVYLNPEDVQGLETGPYAAMVLSPGKNTIFEEGYYKYVDVQNSKTIEQITSPWAAVKPIDIYGLAPMLVYPKVKDMISTTTDDQVTAFTLQVATPTIDMVSVDETYMNGIDILDVRGYTNIAAGSEIEFVMDKDKQTDRTIRENTYVTNVSEDNPHFWRYFQCGIPIDYTRMPVGPHFITATSKTGASQTIPYFIYELPEGSEKPSNTIKYSSGNQFLEPVIVTVTVTVPPVIKEKIVHVAVTPDPAEVAAVTKRNADAAAAYWWTNATFFVIVGAVVIVVGMYAVSVIRRARVKT